MQDITETIIEIIKNNFPNGIRNDFIDIGKVMRILSSPEHENVLRNYIADIIQSNGVECGGRFYFISDADADNIVRLVNGILENHSVAYYVAIFERHADFFKQMHIFSPEVLKKILMRNARRLEQLQGECQFEGADGTIDLEKAASKMSDSELLDAIELAAFTCYSPSTKNYTPAVNARYALLAELVTNRPSLETIGQERLNKGTIEGDFDTPIADKPRGDRITADMPAVNDNTHNDVDASIYCFDEFCATDGATSPADVIKRIFGSTDKSLSIDDVQNRLPYIPSKKIAEELSDAQKYFPTNNDKYLPVDRIAFDADEIDAVKRQISLRIDTDGFAEFDEYEFESNAALNPALDDKRLRALICEQFLADNFTRRGKRLFKKGDRSSKRGVPTARLRKFIFDHEELSYDKLMACAGELGIDRKAALDNAHEIMIRAEKNLFVEDFLIRFDVDGIDDSLTPFVRDKIIPIRAVNSFTGFPPVDGFSWNLFLLESFLRKFSRQYTFAAPAANSANIGAVYPRSMHFNDYIDVQAAIIVQDHVPLEQSAVENFLIEQGYRKNRVGGVIDKIIERSKDFLRR